MVIQNKKIEFLSKDSNNIPCIVSKQIFKFLWIPIYYREVVTYNNDIIQVFSTNSTPSTKKIGFKTLKTKKKNESKSKST